MTEVCLLVILALDIHISTRFSYQLYNYLEKCTMHFVVNYITVKRELLYMYGFGYVWFYEYVGDEGLFFKVLDKS